MNQVEDPVRHSNIMNIKTVINGVYAPWDYVSSVQMFKHEIAAYQNKFKNPCMCLDCPLSINNQTN